MPLKKIDAAGNYIEFPGVTVIAPVGNHNQELWLAVYEFINNSTVLRPYFAPLPYQSYHMTTCNLYTKRAHFNDWLPFINDKLNLMHQLHNKLTETPFIPEISIEHINDVGSLQLNVSIPKKQYDLIKSVADEFGVEHMMPKIFHITLAYEYKAIEQEQDYTVVHQEIAKLVSLCKQHKKKLLLNPPQLCFFHNMEQFTPWNGLTNPFVTNQIPATILSLFDQPKIVSSWCNSL